jgi:hypothetical protein
MKSLNQKHLIAAMLGACLFACNSPSDPVDAVPDPGASPESGSDFDRSALSIKAGPYSQQEKISALQALASRYGHVMTPQANPDPAPNLEEIGKPVAGALGKAAASNRYFLMKSETLRNSFVLEDFRVVKANQTLVASTTRPAGSTADPFLVAFHDTRLIGDRHAMLTKIVGLNDDDAGLDSRFSWKNTTGKDQGVEILVFAYTPELSGRGTLTTTINGGTKRTFTGTFAGIATYNDNMNTLPIANCSGPLSDRLSLQILQRGDAFYSAIMVNHVTMTGGSVGISGTQPDVVLDMPTATPSGYPSFMLLYATGSATVNGTYVGRQDQLFNCNY